MGYLKNSTYVILSKASNFQNAVVVHNNGCSDEDNVNQYKFSQNWNEVWILEPVTRDVDMGVKYAVDNYNKFLFTYPKCIQDCTNFVSQCLLASGIHYQDDWKIYRKNGLYTDVSHNYQLTYSWDVSVPGPWLGAQNFRNFFGGGRVSNVYFAKGSFITENPSVIANLPLTKGCVVQMADNVDGEMSDSYHTLFITDYVNNGNNSTYLLTYHSIETLDKSLLDICSASPDEFFLFYEF